MCSLVGAAFSLQDSRKECIKQSLVRGSRMSQVTSLSCGEFEVYGSSMFRYILWLRPTTATEQCRFFNTTTQCVTYLFITMLQCPHLCVCAVILVIFFLLTFSTHDINNTSTYETLYTACLPYVSMWGVIIPAVCLGADPHWLCLYVAAAVLGPMMIALHQGSVLLERVLSDCQQGRLIAFLMLQIRCLKATMDPVEYHDR